MQKNKYHQRGDHMALVLTVITITLVAIVSFVGFNSYKSQNAQAGSLALARGTFIDMANFGKTNFGASIISANGKAVLKLDRTKSNKGPAQATTDLQNATNYYPSGTPPKNLVRFIESNFSKPAEICMWAKGTSLKGKAAKIKLGIQSVAKGKESDGVYTSSSKQFSLTNSYKKYCFDFTIMSESTYRSGFFTDIAGQEQHRSTPKVAISSQEGKVLYVNKLSLFTR